MVQRKYSAYYKLNNDYRNNRNKGVNTMPNHVRNVIQFSKSASKEAISVLFKSVKASDPNAKADLF